MATDTTVVDRLAERLRNAATKKSLRVMGMMAGVSHERIRQIVTLGDRNVTTETVSKLESMLDAIEC